MEVVIFPFFTRVYRYHGFYEWKLIYLYTICEHDILDINVEFFFLKQYDLYSEKLYF